MLVGRFKITKDRKMTLEELKVELEARKAAKKAELEEVVATVMVQHELTKLTSPLYNHRELTKRDSVTLDVLLDQIAEVYARDNRKMSLTFGYGIIPNKIITLLKAIQFSKAAEKEEFLMMTGLDEQIIEDTLDAFGNTAYFSKMGIEVIDAIPMDIDKVRQLLQTIAVDMKLVSELDLSKFNKANVDYQYKRAQLKADEMLDNTKEYVATATVYEE